MSIATTVKRRLPWFLRRGGSCAHLAQVQTVPAPSTECPLCVAAGDAWFHLRQCLVCGQMGCCDQSKNKHATAHFHASGHPVVRSAQPGQDWTWCYLDELMVTL